MPADFFDTSAPVKRYHREAGTDVVLARSTVPGVSHFVSRLAAVELHSTFAKKVRTGQMTPAAFRFATRRFRSDVSVGRLKSLRLLPSHYTAAIRLIRRLSLTSNLRTLDSLQLAVALSIHKPGQPVTFVSADNALCAVAAAEGLVVVNPEVP